MPDYSGDIPPTLLPQYNALIRQGLPPNVAYSILTQPSVGEGEKPRGAGRWGSYSGWQDETHAGMIGPPRDQALSQQLWNQRETQQENLPTWENHTPGEDDNLGFRRLPSGQYLPYNYQPSSYSPGGNMPWPNLTPQELAAYQMLSGGNAQMGQAQGMNPQLMQAYMAMMAQQQPQGMGQMNPAMGQPTMANMLAARPNASGAVTNLPTTPGYMPSGNNMSTILNNPHLMQLLMAQYGGGAT